VQNDFWRLEEVWQEDFKQAFPAFKLCQKAQSGENGVELREEKKNKA